MGILPVWELQAESNLPKKHSATHAEEDKQTR